MGKTMSDVSQDVKKVSGLVTVWGILRIILGFLAMGAPLVTGLALALMIGIAMLGAGLLQTVYAFQAGSVGRGLLRLLFGGITILAGCAMIG